MDRIVSQPRRIVAISIAAGDREHPLPNQIVQRVHDLARLAPIRKTPRQALRQSQPLIACDEQHRPAVGAAVRLIKPHHQRLTKHLRDNTHCFVLSSLIQRPPQWCTTLG